jgi:hypothetical protein
MEFFVERTGTVFEQDKIDWEWYLKKSCSIYLNRMGSVKNSISLMPGQI